MGCEKSFVIVALVLLVFSVSPMVSAGIGLGRTGESALVQEGEEVCLSYYSVYNPWDDETYVKVKVSDELQEILTLQDTEAILLPPHTSSEESIPMKFCFKVPDNVYEKDCAVGPFLCEMTCDEETKVYGGEVIVHGVPAPAAVGEGGAGSTTQASAAAPLRIRVQCVPYPRDFTLLWVLVAVIAALGLAIVLIQRSRKPKIQRDREKLARLKAEIAKAEGKKPVKRKSAKKKSKKKK